MTDDSLHISYSLSVFTNLQDEQKLPSLAEITKGQQQGRNRGKFELFKL
jgi:hypothetical protein